MAQAYIPRVIDSQLQFKLSCCGAVNIKGPKWCGKSTTAEQAANSAVYLQDRTNSAQQVALAKNAPDVFLEGDAPKLIDEWQVVPLLWDQVRYEVDKRGKMGQFILTGSATPIDEETDEREHSGIGRITPLVMRTMTTWEARNSEGGISLSKLFEGNNVQACKSALSLRDYSFITCRGGWPTAIGLDTEAALEQAYIFYDGLTEDDIQRVFKNARNPERVKRFMRSYARAISTETSISELKRDIAANDGGPLDDETIASYIRAMERLYVVENLHAWNPNIRSKTAIRTSDTRHFVDPSIACAALELGPGDLIADLKTFGLLFESLCVRDLRVYAESLNGEVRHYRDASGLEADAVVHLRGGKWAAFEVKLSSEESIEEGAHNLLTLAEKVQGAPPVFLMVITATEYAYQRDDGVWVVPLGCLEP